MITEVTTAIRGLIAQNFSNVPIYTSNQGEGFARPSYLVSLVTTDTKNMSKLVFNNLITIQIVYFAPLDDYKNVNVENQWATWDTLKSIFDVGFFTTVKGVAKIINITGAPRNGEIYLNINLQITEQRVDVNNDMSSNVPLMENIEFNIQEVN